MSYTCVPMVKNGVYLAQMLINTCLLNKQTKE